MFWSHTLPADVFADEPARLAAARAQLAAEVAYLPVDSFWICEAMSALGEDWTLRSCGDSLPNTHWHLLSNNGIWVGWRAHLIRNSGILRYADMSVDERRRHLSQAVAVSPVAESLPDLIDELARHGTSIGDRENTYPYAEVHAIQMALGVTGPDAEDMRMLAALDGFPSARALCEGRGMGFAAQRSQRPMPPLDQVLSLTA